MGLIFKNFVPANVVAKRKRLMPNCHGLMKDEEKFSSVIKSRAAAASSPTTGNVEFLCNINCECVATDADTTCNSDSSFVEYGNISVGRANIDDNC